MALANKRKFRLWIDRFIKVVVDSYGSKTVRNTDFLHTSECVLIIRVLFFHDTLHLHLDTPTKLHKRQCTTSWEHEMKGKGWKAEVEVILTHCDANKKMFKNI